jgi:hypothetical protein
MVRLSHRPALIDGDNTDMVAAQVTAIANKRILFMIRWLLTNSRFVAAIAKLTLL